MKLLALLGFIAFIIHYNFAMGWIWMAIALAILF